MKTMSRLALFLFGIALLGMVGAVGLARGEESEAAWVVFQGDFSLYTVMLDGSNLTPIADVSAVAPFPTFARWQADSNTLVFKIEDTYYRTRPLSRRPQQLIRIAGDSWWVESSRDGQWLLLQVSVMNADSNLYRRRWDGTQYERLTDADGYYRFVSLSPDSEWIYYRSEEVNDYYLARMRWDGSGNQVVTRSMRPIEFVGWSSDQEWMIVRSVVDQLTFLFRVNVENGNVEQLMDDQLSYYNLTLVSPDGKWVIYDFENPFTINDIILMRSDGSDRHRATVGLYWSTFLTWSPDGEWVIFRATKENKEGLYRVHLESGVVESLVNSLPGLMISNATYWIPDSDCFVYTLEGSIQEYLSDVKCLDSGRTYRLISPSTHYRLEGWSPVGKWGIVTHRRSDAKVALYRIASDGTSLERISPYFGSISGLVLSPIIDLDWNAKLMNLISLIAIGGGLCGSYWFSRE